MSIQDEAAKIHHKYGTTELANYKIQLLFDQETDKLKSDVKLKAILFAKWLQETGWTWVYSHLRLRGAYVNSKEHAILVNGSGLHYSVLVGDHGKSLDELYGMCMEELENNPSVNKETA